MYCWHVKCLCPGIRVMMCAFHTLTQLSVCWWCVSVPFVGHLPHPLISPAPSFPEAYPSDTLWGIGDKLKYPVTTICHYVCTQLLSNFYVCAYICNKCLSSSWVPSPPTIVITPFLLPCYSTNSTPLPPPCSHIRLEYIISTRGCRKLMKKFVRLWKQWTTATRQALCTET